MEDKDIERLNELAIVLEGMDNSYLGGHFKKDYLVNTALQAASRLEQAEKLMKYKIPCEVYVAPATKFGKGVKLGTVIGAIKRREDVDEQSKILKRPHNDR